jgi:hypothetical protein
MTRREGYGLDRLLQALEQARSLYQPVALLVAPRTKATAAALGEAARALDTRVLNLNLALGAALGPLSAQARRLELARLLDDLAREVPGQALVLDGTEILFEPSLGHDPLRLLQGLSRSRPVLALWPGSRQGGVLLYGPTGHPEHRRYESHGAILVDPGG